MTPIQIKQSINVFLFIKYRANMHQMHNVLWIYDATFSRGSYTEWTTKCVNNIHADRSMRWMFLGFFFLMILWQPYWMLPFGIAPLKRRKKWTKPARQLVEQLKISDGILNANQSEIEHCFVCALFLHFFFFAPVRGAHSNSKSM